MNHCYEIRFRNIGPAIGGNEINGLKTWKEIAQFNKPFEINKVSLGYTYKYLITVECSEIVRHFEEICKGNYIETCSLYLNVVYEDTHGLTYIPTIPISLFLQDLFLACSLSRPGSLNLGPDEIESPKQNIRLRPLYSDIIEVAYDSCMKWGWPTYDDISFSETWEWLSKIGYLNSVVANSPPAKACSTIIQLSGSGWLGPSEILSMSIALESLLTSHKYGVSKQIRDRLNLIFGVPCKDKKWVTKFYDERSKIVHGSANLPRPYAEIDFNEDGQKLYMDCCDYAYRAIGITIALLKKLIKNQSTGFNFTENYNFIPFE